MNLAAYTFHSNAISTDNFGSNVNNLYENIENLQTSQGYKAVFYKISQDFREFRFFRLDVPRSKISL